MTIGGWVVMILSVGFVTGLLAWCVAKVFSEPDASQRVHAPPDIDTHDRNE